jgi:hypothetical protein
MKHGEQGYGDIPVPTLFPSVTEEQLKKELPLGELNALRQHALCLACLQGNSFYDLIDQYLVDAYNNLWSNSSLDDGNYFGIRIRNLYPMTAGQHWDAVRRVDMQKLGVDPDSPNAATDYVKAWLNSNHQEEQKPSSGLAIMVDGNVTEVLDVPDSMIDIAVATIRELVDSLKKDEKDFLSELSVGLGPES